MTSQFTTALKAYRDTFAAGLHTRWLPNDQEASDAALAAYDAAATDGTLNAELGTGNLWRPADQGLLAWTLDPEAATGEITLTDGTLFLGRVHCPTAAPISDIWVDVTTPGTTVAHGFLALYSTAGHQLARTADLTTLFNTAALIHPALAARDTAADGHTTDTSPAISSATAQFTAADVGASITGTNIPGATTILSVQSPTQATMSADATGTATTTIFTIGTTTVTPTAGTDILVAAVAAGDAPKLAGSAAPAAVLNAAMGAVDYAARFMEANTGLTTSVPYAAATTNSNTAGAGFWAALS